MWCADVRGCDDVGVGAFPFANTVVEPRVTFDLGKPKIWSRAPSSTCRLDLKIIHIEYTRQKQKQASIKRHKLLTWHWI